MSGGPRRSAERRHTADIAPYEVPAAAGAGLKFSTFAEAIASEPAASPTIVIHPQGDHVFVGVADHYGFAAYPVLGPVLPASNGFKAVPNTFVDYSWPLGDTAAGRETGGHAELQATVRVITLNPSGPGFMNPIAERLAELTRHYPLATSFDWKKMQAVLGPARIFAIESEPVTFDVDQNADAFTGRARVLADLLDPSDSKTFLEPRVLDAQVHGRFEDGVPSIAAFEFQNAG